MYTKLVTLITCCLIGIACSDLEIQKANQELDVEQLLTENEPVAALGRVLFYDRQLSQNNTVSCASCHKQHLAFADDVAFSVGLEDKLTDRNSMPIQNLENDGFSFDQFGNDVIGPSVTHLFWDGRETDLNTMVMQPILNHVEMGIRDLNDLASKLNQNEYYQELSFRAFDTPTLDPDLMSEALATFLKEISSRNTRFDKSLRGHQQLNAQEEVGQELFFTKYNCNSCHQTQTPNGYIFAGTFANVGLEKEYEDLGLANVTGNEFDVGKFKIPSLRNVSLTAPYMHDGRFETLEDVIDHYSTGMRDNDNLDIRLRNAEGDPLKLNVTNQEKRALVAFLNTLTDYEMIQDPKLSDPFTYTFK